jgi:hypothetical protein
MILTCPRIIEAPHKLKMLSMAGSHTLAWDASSNVAAPSAHNLRDAHSRMRFQNEEMDSACRWTISICTKLKRADDTPLWRECTAQLAL